MPFLNVRGLALYYETAGDPAAPPVLILSGLTDYTAKSAWQVRELAEDFLVITFDNRGAGRSSPATLGYTAADLAGDAAAVLDALAIPVAHVFGFSLGGMIALHLALDYPERVARLALGCTTAGGRLGVLPDERVYQSLMQPIQTGDRRADFFNGVWVSVGDRCLNEQPELVERLADIAIANPQTGEGYAGQMQAVLTHDVADRLAEIRVPTLVLHGAADLMIPPDNGRLLAENIPGAKFILYPDAGHLFFIEQAAAVNRALRDFFLAPETAMPLSTGLPRP